MDGVKGVVGGNRYFSPLDIKKIAKITKILNLN